MQASPHQRLAGLSASEKKMILFVRGEEDATGKGRGSYKILDIAASISDGDLGDCQVK